MNDLPGLCPSHARLFLELVPFGTQPVDPIEHPLQELLRVRPSKCQPVEASGCPTLTQGRQPDLVLIGVR
jgi:hypothetical protein